jgi:hypothetical protein
MKIAIMQPYFFPYIGYFQLINAVDIFVIYDDVNFIKQGWISRNRILMNCAEHLMTLQLSGASSNKHINKIKIGNNQDKLLKTIFHAYHRAPFFDRVYPLIVSVLTNQEQNLSLFLAQLLQSICFYLNIKTKLILSSSFEKDNRLKGYEKGIEICKRFHADTYINAIGGKSLYSKDEFLAHGIDLLFIRTNEIVYKQLNCEFVPSLSIIDVMMFNPIGKIQEMLSEYELV